MSLTFAGTPIKGLHGPLVLGAPAAQAIVQQYWDLASETEIVGKLGGRDITCRVWMYGGFNSASALLAALKQWQLLSGTHGTLMETLSNEQIPYEFCTLRTVTPIASEGQEEPGPLQDIGGTLDGGWWINLEFHWRQLKVR